MHTPRRGLTVHGAWSRITSLVMRLHAAGLSHVFLAIVSIQGAAYVTQLMLAGVLGPESFGVVRKTEGILALLLVLGSAGMPSLAVSLMGRTPSAGQGGLLLRLMSLAFGASAVVAVIAAAISLTVTADDLPVARIVWLICLAATSRVCFSYFQGIQAPHRAALVVGALSLVSIPIVCVLASVAGIPGWIIGRYLAEALLLGGLLALTAQTLRRAASAGGRTWGSLLGLGLPVVVSLLMRTAIEQAPILFMEQLGVSSLETGYFGFATLIVTALLLVSGAIVAILVPRFSSRVDRPLELRRLFLVASPAVFGTVVVLGLLFAVFLRALTELALPGYVPSVPLVTVLLLCSPFRALAAVAGAVLLAVERNAFQAVANVCMLAVLVGLMMLLVPRYGIFAAAWAVVITEVLGAVIYVGWAWHQIRVIQRSGEARS